MKKAYTTRDVEKLESHAIDRLGIPVFTLMDHAGKAVAQAAQPLAGKNGPVVVLSGSGHNGGDGVAAARWLRGWGYTVTVLWLKNPSEWKGSAALHAAIAQRAGVTFKPFDSIPPSRRVATLQRAHVIIDALLGTGFEGRLRLPLFDAISCIKASRRPVVSIDVPSGLDATTGLVSEIAVRAHTTVTMSCLKKGFLRKSAKSYLGRLQIADLGIPL